MPAGSHAPVRDARARGVRSPGVPALALVVPGSARSDWTAQWTSCLWDDPGTVQARCRTASARPPQLSRGLVPSGRHSSLRVTRPHGTGNTQFPSTMWKPLPPATRARPVTIRRLQQSLGGRPPAGPEGDGSNNQQDVHGRLAHESVGDRWRTWPMSVPSERRFHCWSAGPESGMTAVIGEPGGLAHSLWRADHGHSNRASQSRALESTGQVSGGLSGRDRRGPLRAADRRRRRSKRPTSSRAHPIRSRRCAAAYARRPARTPAGAGTHRRCRLDPRAQAVRRRTIRRRVDPTRHAGSAT